jgi:hypothetical protein
VEAIQSREENNGILRALRPVGACELLSKEPHRLAGTIHSSGCRRPAGRGGAEVRVLRIPAATAAEAATEFAHSAVGAVIIIVHDRHGAGAEQAEITSSRQAPPHRSFLLFIVDSSIVFRPLSSLLLVFYRASSVLADWSTTVAIDDSEILIFFDSS